MFKLADSDLKKVEAMNQMAMQWQMQDMVSDIVSGTTESFQKLG